MLFGKVLIANRGEIAVRIIRACRELGIATMAVYSDADRASLHVRMADQAAHIGPSPSSDSYLSIGNILEAARRYGADAIHPGYGFLSENAEFAQACEEQGVTFIGPSSRSVRLMGSKINARVIAEQSGVPVLPGATVEGGTFEGLHAAATQIGYPVLIKADAGGGGKGMRRANTSEELHDALRDASSEAERSFKTGSVYIEKFLERPRHIEIQIFGDAFGNLIHLGERECSIQRRHQKIIEESPSPLMERYPELRGRMGAAAVQVARSAGYVNAGTVEFLVGEKGDFYFLEMNTRLQVEHPVTELVTGLDLVHLQLEVAAGLPLRLRQDDVRWRGSAIECRVYAEDPEQDFFPSPGVITHLRCPEGPGVRLDSGVYSGWNVPVDYDPLLAKLAVWAENRPTAIARMQRAAAEFSVGGIATNLALFGEVLADEEFREGNLHTGFLPEWRARRKPHANDPEHVAAAVVVAAAVADQGGRPGSSRSVPRGRLSSWLMDGRSSALR